MISIVGVALLIALVCLIPILAIKCPLPLPPPPRMPILWNKRCRCGATFSVTLPEGDSRVVQCCCGEWLVLGGELPEAMRSAKEKG